MSRIAIILASLFIVAPLALAADDKDKDKDKDKQKKPKPHKPGKNGKSRQSDSANGAYHVLVGGSVKGAGSASISETSVSIQAAVQTADGAKGTLVATQLVIDGPYFSGTGTAMGQAITIRGRLDAHQNSRVVADYSSASGHIGRIVGTYVSAE